MMGGWRNRQRRGKTECPPHFFLIKEPACRLPWFFANRDLCGIGFHAYGYRTRREAAVSAWKFYNEMIEPEEPSNG
jgi:hypothetical protein